MKYLTSIIILLFLSCESNSLPDPEPIDPDDLSNATIIGNKINKVLNDPQILNNFDIDDIINISKTEQMNDIFKKDATTLTCRNFQIGHLFCGRKEDSSDKIDFSAYDALCKLVETCAFKGALYNEKNNNNDDKKTNSNKVFKL